MKLYKIKDWGARYENNRTRELKKIDWVPVPNSQDGEGYTLILAQPEGPALFGAWMAILQVASRCGVRGTLLRDTQKPHDSASLARLTRFPQALMQQALDFLSGEEMQWLEVEEYQSTATETAKPCDNPAPSCDNPASSCLEGNGREEKGMSEKGSAPAHAKPSAENERRNQPDPKRDLEPFKPLQTPEFESSWAEWLAYKASRREADPTEQYLPNTRRVNLDQLARLGVARAIAIVRFSLGRGSKGLIFDPKPEELSAFLPKPAAQASAARQSDETETKAAALARAVRDGLPEAAELKKSASTAILSAAMGLLDVDGKNRLHRLGKLPEPQEMRGILKRAV